MSRKIMLLLGLLVLGSLNYSIFQYERIIDSGETVLLELAPVDPRSLMQGDFMRLRYAVERSANELKTKSTPESGHLLVRPDAMNVGHLVGFAENEKSIEGDKLLRYHMRGSRVRVSPDAFFFQEGQGEKFENSKYGVFKFGRSGSHLLVGLAGENGKTIISD